MRTKRIVIVAGALLLALGLAGCGTARFSHPTERAPLAAAAEVSMAVEEGSLTESGLTLLITNATAREMTYGMEFSLERKRGDAWYAMDEDDRAFADLAAILAPGETNRFSVTWEGTLPAGEYRVVKTIWLGDGEERLLAAPFCVA